MDVSAFADIGQRIVELSFELKQRKAELEKAQSAVTALEQELMPLVTQHAKMVAELVGPAAVSTETRVLPEAGRISPSGDSTVPASIRQKVISFLQTGPEGLGPPEIADRLKLDVTVVRDVMRELVTAGFTET